MLTEYIFWISSIIFAVIIIGIAVLIILRDSKSPISITSFVFMLFAFIWMLTGIIHSMELKGFFKTGNIVYIYYINLFSGNILPWLALMWSYSFPQKSKYFNIKNIILFLCVGIPSVLSITIYLGSLYQKDGYLFSIIYYLFNNNNISLIYPLILDFVIIVLLISNQIHYYLNHANDREKGKIRFFLIGFSVTLIFNLLSPMIMAYLDINMPFYIGYIGITVGMLLASYSIIKPRTLDIGFFFNRLFKAIIKSLLYSIPVVIALRLYIQLNFSVIHVIPKIVLIIAGIILYYLYIALINNIISKLFERKILNIETALRSLFDNIVGVKSKTELARLIMNGLRAAIAVDEFSFYIITENPLSFNLLLSNENTNPKKKLYLPRKLSELMIKENYVLERNDVNRFYENKPLVNFLEMYFNFFDCKIVVPIIYGNKVAAIINIKNKYDKSSFNNSDIEFINSLRQGIAVGIMNSMLYDDLIKERKKLEDRVKSRTIDLTMTNKKLSEALEELETKHEELKDAQLYLLQSEKMASLGELVAGITHEVNSPLGTIQSSIDMINRLIIRLKNNSSEKEELEKSLMFLQKICTTNSDAVSKLTSVFTALKQFSKLDESSFKTVNIENELDYIISLLRYKIQDRIKITKDYSGVPHINCYASELNQAFMNILTNSIESIEGKGNINIITKFDSDKVIVIFEDDGMGISKDIFEKVFNPGFTTKGAGIGKGLGLSVSYNIIKKHNGDIFFESKEGKGTTTTILIDANLKN